MARDMDRISTVILKCFFNCSHFAQFTYRVCFCIAFDVKWPINKRIPREDYERDTKLSHDLLISSFETRETLKLRVCQYIFQNVEELFIISR